MTTRAHIHTGGRMRNSIRRYAIYLLPLLPLATLAGLIQWHGQLPYPDDRFLGYDHYKYIAMAEHPFGADPLARTAPFCWRILTPLLVHALPVPVLTGFWLVTLAGLAGATLGLMWFMRGVNVSTAGAIAGGCAFVLLGPATGVTLWDYMLVDPLAFAFLVWALGCSVRRHGPALALVLIVAAAEKETALLAAVFAVVWAASRRDWPMLRWATAGLVGCVGVLVAVRLALPASAPYNLLTEMQRAQKLEAPSPSAAWRRLMVSTGGVWNVMLPLAALQLAHRPRWLRSPAVLLLLLAATAQIAVSLNTERVVVYGFPAVITACAFEVEYLAVKLRAPQWLLWTPVLVLQAPWYAPMARLNDLGPWFGDSLRQLNTVAVDQDLVVATVVAIVWAMAAPTVWRRFHGAGGPAPEAAHAARLVAAARWRPSGNAEARPGGERFDDQQ